MAATAVDFAAKLIDPFAIKAAGHSAVLVYVSPNRETSNFEAKPVPKWYTDKCREAGLEIVSIWQLGKPGDPHNPSDWTTGWAGGHRMATEARDRHFAAGGPGLCPIYFAVDEDLSLNLWNSYAVDFFRGAGDAIGKDWVGIYGSAKVCSWAIEDDVIGRTSEGKRWAWQTRAWSGNKLDTPQATLYQRVIDTPSNPGPKIDGASVDVNDILAADYGQWSIDRGPTEPNAGGKPEVAKPNYTEIARMGNSRSNRWGARITNFLLHTQEGNGSAESLASYLNNSSNGVSYHYTLREGILVDVVDTDYASWSVLDANSHTINLCFAGSRASWSRDQWLAIDNDLRVAAYIAVQDAKKYGFSTEVITPPYHRADGISDHYYVTKALGIGNHTDVGPNFPWDVFTGYVNEYAHGITAAPAVNLIDQKASESSWLGERITKGENVTPDGKGRWAQFENGHLYWTAETGAHPIPASIWDKFEELRWETGPLGYPITDHTVLRDKDGNAWGDVQGFQGGAVYRRYGQEPFFIHGDIRKRWDESGFENGPLGWPESDEYPLDGGAAQDFENGVIVWPGSKSTAVILDD